MTNRQFPAAKHFLVCLANLLVWFGTSNAHQDPAGDVHPRIQVEDANFVVYFWNNVEKKPQESSKIGEGEVPSSYPIYRTVISRQGQVLALREACANLPIRRPDFPLKEDERGIGVEAENGVWLIFPSWARIHHGRPFMIRLVDGKKEVQQFDWDRSDVDVVHSVVKANDDIVFVVSFQSSRGEPAAEGAPFYFYRFTKDGRRLLGRKNIGVPARIYYFPVCSNIVAQPPRYMISWVTGNVLYLSIWDTSRDTLKSQVLEGPVDWNMALSMARIDNALLVAYHEKGAIKTRMVNLDDASARE